MSYPTGHYGPGLRGLGGPLDLSMTASDLIPFDASVGSFQSYLDWAAPGQAGVASNSPSPTATTNQSGSAPKTQVSVGQWAANNSGLLIVVALGLLAITLVKR